MKETQENSGSGQHGLLYLRGQGETKWVSHAGVPWLRETPTGLEIDLEDTLREGTRQERLSLVLLGHPGGGKTHALQRLESLCLRGEGERLGLSAEVLPLSVDLEEWNPEAGSVESWLEENVQDHGGKASGLVLVDGLDRLPLPERQAAADWLRRAAAKLRLVVTCGHGSYEPGVELGEAFLEVQLVAPVSSTQGAGPETSAPAPDLQEVQPRGARRAAQGGYLLLPIPGGRFQMGSPDDEPERWGDEGPRRDVEVAPCFLGPKPVTNGEFALFLDAQPNEPEPGFWRDPRFNRGLQPVVGVSWDQAQRYAAWAGLRLPSEAEWEYACRATTTGTRYGDLDQVAWHAGNSGGELQAVGTRAANAWGLFDMLGNAWEWVEDDHHRSYEGAPGDSRPWIDEPRGSLRLLRGGSWADNPRTVRAATRLTNHPGPRVGNVGFRLAADV